MTGRIEMKLVETNVYTRWPCTVCGGVTEKVSILCEGGRNRNHDRVGDLRVCEFCLEAGNIDERLREHADHLEDEAKRLRGLLGRLQVPTYTDWQAAIDARNLEWVQENTGFKTCAEYEAHLKEIDSPF